MATARNNPLEPGVYWIDVFSPTPFNPSRRDDRPTFAEWLKRNPASVKVQSREHFEDNRTAFRDFFVFQVLARPTVAFPFKQLGFPTIVLLAPPEQVKPADVAIKSDDTVRKPPPEPDFDWGIFSSFATAGMTPLLVLGALYLLSKGKR